MKKIALWIAFYITYAVISFAVIAKALEFDLIYGQIVFVALMFIGTLMLVLGIQNLRSPK